MIHEVDEVLRGMIRARVLPEVITDVEFAAPTRDWAARRNAPTVNLFLHDVREELARRQRGQTAVHGPLGEVLRREQPPRWFRLSYLVTAWTSRPEDEHRLLSALLVALLRYDALPPAELTPGLAASGLPVPMSIAVPDESRSATDLWSSLGGELRPSLDLVVLAPFPGSPQYEVGPPVTEDFTLAVRGDDGVPADTAVRDFRAERAERENGTAR